MQTPIYTALKTYMKSNRVHLHMPGHSGGRHLIPPELEAVAGIDCTEIPGLDDLHQPTGIIAQAQELLARACGAQASFFLLNGATSGIHTLIMSCQEKERIILPRNAHRSFYGGMVLAGVEPVYLPCQTEPELGIALAVETQEIEKQLRLHPDAQAVFVTSPSYYGTCCDLSSIVGMLNRRGKLLMVDEAHGSHFPFHPSYPESALEEGAAAAVNGLHKTWPVLTQAACLHWGRLREGDRQPDSVERYHRWWEAYHLLTTTSPAYPLMASIDWARGFMEAQGYLYLERALQLSREYKPKLDCLKGIRCYRDELTRLPGVKAVDPLKVLIGVQGLSLTGYEVGKILREDYNIEVELMDQNLILAMFSPWHEQEEWDQFYRAMEKIAGSYPAIHKPSLPVYEMPAWQMIMTPRQAFYAPKRKVSLDACRGHIAGEMIAAYPPGIPCLMPGEEISDEIWDYLYYLQKSGARIQGPEEADLQHIYIIE